MAMHDNLGFKWNKSPNLPAASRLTLSWKFTKIVCHDMLCIVYSHMGTMNNLSFWLYEHAHT